FNTVSPSDGTALVTVFTVVTAEWGDDLADYPLYFEYKYQTSPLTPELSIQAKTTSNVVTSVLPSGLGALDSQVTLLTYISDSLGATASDLNTVVVQEGEVDLSVFVSDSLATALAAGDSVGMGQIISASGSTIR
ncbi:hypothetical protein B484DRAFT_407176, partial [Ochromonadaceae sp. CCMP2298]